MRRSSAGCLAAYPPRENARFSGISAEEHRLHDNLLKLRAVLILLAAGRGAKVTTARSLAIELSSTGLKASLRSLYTWRKRYLKSGFAGIERRRRNDCGIPRGFDAGVFAQIVDAATRVKRYGDLAREFRQLGAAINRETFRTWVRAIQKQLKVIELPERGASNGRFF